MLPLLVMRLIAIARYHETPSPFLFFSVILNAVCMLFFAGVLSIMAELVDYELERKKRMAINEVK